MMKYISYVVLLLALIIVVFLFFEDKPINDSFSKEYKIQKVEIKLLNESIFLKQAVWGISSDSKLTVISTNSDKIVDYESESDYVFRSGSTLFFKVKEDTLYIKSMELANEPTLFKSDVIIYQEKIENREFLELIESHNKLGYMRFPY